MEGSGASFHFNWVDHEPGGSNTSSPTFRRLSAFDFGSTTRDAKRRRFSVATVSDPREYSKIAKHLTSLNDLSEIKLPIPLNSKAGEGRYTSEEKRTYWSKRHQDSGILSSFDSYSSANNISSIDALLDERKVNAEQVLTNLGFAPCVSELKLEHRIPKRFLHTDDRSRRAAIERFVKAHPDQFHDLLSRRKLLNARYSMDDGKFGHLYDCDSSSTCSEPNSGRGRDFHDLGSFSFPEEQHFMINDDSVIRLLRSNLPHRYLVSLHQRVSNRNK